MGVSISRRFPELAPTDQFAVEDVRAGIIGLDRVPELHTNDFTSLDAIASTAGTVTLLAGELGHPGIVRVTTGSSTNDVGNIYDIQGLPTSSGSGLTHAEVLIRTLGA